MSELSMNPVATSGRILSAVNAVTRGRGHFEEAVLARLRADAEALRSSDPEAHLVARGALESVCGTPASTKAVFGGGLPASGGSPRSVDAAVSALMRVSQHCAAAELLLACPDAVAASPALLKRALPVHFLAGRLREAAEAAARLRAMGQAGERDRARQGQAERCQACLHAHGDREQDLQALCRLRDQAVEESGVAPSALRGGAYRLMVDDADAAALLTLYFPLAGREEVHAIRERHWDLVATGSPSTALLCCVACAFANGAGADTETTE